MALKLYLHPLASYCQKVLVALYEKELAFEGVPVNLFDEKERARLVALWPHARFPVLEDDARGRVVPESTCIIDYLETFHPGENKLIPSDPELALECRFLDRVFDLHVHEPMQRVVGDRLRPEGKKDPEGVERARAQLATSYDWLDQRLAKGPWALGETYSLADCAASPSLFFANEVQPFRESHPALFAYLGRLRERPSFARAQREAEPFMKLFPRG